MACIVCSPDDAKSEPARSAPVTDGGGTEQTLVAYLESHSVIRNNAWRIGAMPATRTTAGHGTGIAIRSRGTCQAGMMKRAAGIHCIILDCAKNGHSAGCSQTGKGQYAQQCH